MGFRRLLISLLTAVLAGSLGAVVVSQPATADSPVYLRLLWIRCQDETGDAGNSDEIWVGIDDQQADYFDDFDVRETKWFFNTPPINLSIRPFTDDEFVVSVWEQDPGYRQWLGQFLVYRSEVNTGEHEGYAFFGGQYIVRYVVYT
jgi:hypothetical protein